MSDAEIKVHLVEIAGRNIALRWIDPKSGKWRQKSARTRVVREAERAAARLEKELAAGISPAGRLPTWDEFCERYEDVKLPSAAKNTGDLWRTVANSIEEFDAEQTELARMKRLVDLTADRLEKWHKWLRDKPVAEATIASYTRTLLAALKWGVGKAMLAVVPKIELPERNTRKGRKMRGKALSQDEFARMLAAVPRVVPAADVDEWKRLLEGMWLSGLRISEALELSWDEGERLSVDFAGRRPKLRFFEESHKGHRDEIIPITPDFAEFLARTPRRDRAGRVFPVPSTYYTCVDLVSDIGEAAAVIVDRKAEKFATSHDLRRSFGTRWAQRVKPAVLQKLMRHKSIETTLKFYVDFDADELGDELWRWAEKDSPKEAGESQ